VGYYCDYPTHCAKSRGFLTVALRFAFAGPWWEGLGSLGSFGWNMVLTRQVAPLVGHAEEEEEKEGVEEEAPSSELVALEPKEEQKQEPKDEQTQEPNEEPQEQTEEQRKEPMQQQTPTPAKPHVKRLAGEVAALQLQLAEAKRLLEGKDAKPKVAAGLARPTLRDMAQQAVGRAGARVRGKVPHSQDHCLFCFPPQFLKKYFCSKTQMCTVEIGEGFPP